MDEPMMHEIRGVSIVIPNYNYGRFLGEAIDSALAQTHAPVEVIVVDDGSTDNSRAVIERYGDRVTAIFQANAGQTKACEAGFRRSRHPIVMFLDSDDRLVPHAAATVVADWTPNLAKLQFCLETIDAESRRLGFFWPKYPSALGPERIRKDLLTKGEYVTPPTSGNAFSRAFLEAVAAFDHELSIDSILNTLAPLYGDVRTLVEPLALYRVHGGNKWAKKVLIADRFTYYDWSLRRRIELLAYYCGRLGIAFDGPQVLERSLSFREVCLARAKLSSGPLGLNRAVFTQGGLLAKAAFGERARGRHTLLRVLWSLGVTLTPRSIASYLIALRFVQISRPKLVEGTIRMASGWRWHGRATRPARRAGAI
jgi:glycosyltransferase involved in cell wall biosynthesis